ncbi:uncharacterized protein UV8b_00259 [Ustilaginoidea virens]|uniref:DNA replication checkpoint mediator MRC1 domain-containing protein n=1 Tax=Ustilaginoidea virens TaxID=1159556 RepID=A0A1B5KZC2_USTVR|nr:uncharacterized protein UV8b_00259 [Ustilaginoidea virens]QUC16018.1 hypothetical protein UV8b_00259 [Ustilaginoidea virens]GAO16382.1 hypothetical protein UVI_02049640 [Ustilaginoidea virens]
MVSSPALRGSSPEPLTPRSKIRALLETVESSDGEGEEQSNSSSLGPTVRHVARLGPKSWNNDDSDESDIVARPRGKLVSRMQGAPRMNGQMAAETARERVKKMLERQDAQQDAERMSNGDGQDDDLPLAPRRLKRPAATEKAPGPVEQLSRSPSPGLFVSSPVRPSPGRAPAVRDDSENELPAPKSDRFKALVERKRRERLEREAAEAARVAEREARHEQLTSELEQLLPDDDDDDDDGGITDDEGGRRLSQKSRPARKASKKAIEEMNRETQRLARNMQLAHEPKTRRKFSMASLFERFNYRPAGEPVQDDHMDSSSRHGTPQSDAGMNDADTPPSSPPMTKQTEEASTAHGIKITSSGSTGTATPATAAKQPSKRRVRVRLPAAVAVTTFDSGDELEITTTSKNKFDRIFDNIPRNKSAESRSLQALRALAQVRSAGSGTSRKADRFEMTAGELQVFLATKAREQARLERDRRLDILRGQGIAIQTAEEREKQEQEVEDLVAKARQEAQKIMEQERDQVRREKKASGCVDPLAWDDSEDDEYRGSDDEGNAAPSEVDVSGSEDDETAEDDEAGGGREVKGNSLFDEAAECSGSEVSEGEQDAARDDDEDEMEGQVVVTRQRRKRNTNAVLSDDEAGVEATPRPAEVATQTTPAAAGAASVVAPSSVLRSAKKTFIPGLPVQGPAGLGLTQIFAGTMDSQMGGSTTGGPTQSMMPDFDQFPDSNFSATADEPLEDVLLDSQNQNTYQTTQGVQLNLSQSQMYGLDTLAGHGPQTQISELMELSQDGGLQQQTPLRDRFAEPPLSTAETMIVEKQGDDGLSVQDSPLVRKGRLRRRMDMLTMQAAEPESSESIIPSTEGNAFRSMADAAKKERKLLGAKEFDRKKSKAKEMIEEQAEESEDEYAGLGGADGEESDSDSAGSVEEMIDDAAGNDRDEGKLAAFFADRERADDEQQVEKLFKDISKGMLRRKRGADLDLSDSDDGGEARRRMKRRQFAKLQKALFADERVKKIAENPGNRAFLRTIEDRGSDDDDDDDDDEADFLGGLLVEAPAQPLPTSTTTIPDSQPQPQPQSQAAAPGGIATGPRPAAHLRRTKDGRKPPCIGQVRQTLSDLLDEGSSGSVVPATEAGGSDSEQDDDGPAADKENQAPPPPPPPPLVIDRIELKRRAAACAATATATRMAFGAAQAPEPLAFKVPPLLRRATTNSSLLSAAAPGDSAPSAGGFGQEARIKKGAGKRSGIGGFARQNEQRAKARESERRRQERKIKGAARRIGMVGGLLGRGSFDQHSGR